MQATPIRKFWILTAVIPRPRKRRWPGGMRDGGRSLKTEVLFATEVMIGLKDFTE